MRNMNPLNLGNRLCIFLRFDIGFWNCFESVVFFVFRFISPLDIIFAILASFPVNYLQYI
jgi:hypothetical protein